MKKFTKVMLTLFTVCITLGLVFSIAAVAMGANWVDFVDAAHNGRWNIAWDSSRHRLVVGQDAEKALESKHIEEKFTDVESLEIDLNICDLEVIPYNGKEILLSADMRGCSLKAEMDGKTLEISDEDTVNTISLGGDNTSFITLKVPKEMTFKELEADIDMGRVRIEDINAKSAALSCNMGEILYSGQVEKKGEFECSMGNIEATLTGNEKDYNYNIECAMGSVTIGSEKISGLGGSKKIDNGASKNLELDCGMGSIGISFEGGN